MPGADRGTHAEDGALSFGQFELQPYRRLLLRDRIPVKIGDRAFDLLDILIQRRGDVVAKEELIAHVWPNVFVHETNLKVNMSNLRRILGDTGQTPTYIATISGRGYQFIAPVVEKAGATVEFSPALQNTESTVLPEICEVIGREKEIDDVVRWLEQRRMVTLVGPGGVGKTTVAIAAARGLMDAFPDGICFIDLSAHDSEAQVADVVASSLGVRGNPIDATRAIVESVGSRKKLIILDSCEHVIHSARALVSEIFQSDTASRILVTSRERIASREETVIQIGTLPVPQGNGALSAEEALRFASVELLVARAREWNDFSFHSAQANAIAAICRSLDGLPLALEIAASQFDKHEPVEIVSMLDEHLASFDNWNANAPSRQRTLRATLDWSYRLLSADEAVIFRFLSIFAGSFDLESALAVLGPLGFDAYQITIGLGALVGKSLVAAHADDVSLSYRLLDSARLYAAEQAKRDDRIGLVWDSYASHLVTLFARAEDELMWRKTSEWRAQYGPRLNDLRQALDWCFGRGGRPDVGTRLTTSALVLWDEFSNVTEAQPRIVQALAYAESRDLDVMSLAKLAFAHAWYLMYAKQIPPESVEAWKLAIDYAQRSGELLLHLRALWGFAGYLCHTGRYERTLAILDDYRRLAVAGEQWAALPDCDWLYAVAEIYLGRLTSARDRLEKLEPNNPLISSKTHLARIVVDRSMMLRTYLSLALWVTGKPERALAIAQEVSTFDKDIRHLVSQICHAAWSRLPIAFWNDDLAALSTYTAKIRSYLEIENIQVWHPVHRFHQALVDYHDGDKQALRAMRDAIDDLIESNLIVRVPSYLGLLSEALLREDRLDDARSTIREALALADRHREAWTTPELLRISANIGLATGDKPGGLEELWRARHHALDIGAIFFALRASNDLADAYLADGQPQRAIGCLQPIFAHYTEGFATHDLVRSSRLLDRARTELVPSQEPVWLDKRFQETDP
jgi:predicted ATPase/DNA-binding winged helix-turn-helix (wHTH) protein